MNNARGFTVVEVVIAIVILSLGILGLVSTAAQVTRMVGQGARYSQAGALATERFEQLRATTCASMTSGSETRGGYYIRWSVSSSSSNDGVDSRQVILQVVSPTVQGSRSRTDNFTTVIPCE